MIVGVLNIKGGVGKTTTALALATAASREGGRVRVLDADPQGTATLWADTAERGGDPLPFAVESVNRAGVRRLGREGADGETVFIDCPPNGGVVSEAVRASGFVVVPSLASPIDLQQTMRTCAACQDAGTDYAVLIVMARRGTNALKAFRTAVAGSGAGLFDTEIPLRESFRADFGHTFRSNLHGYEDAWREIREATR